MSPFLFSCQFMSVNLLIYSILYYILLNLSYFQQNIVKARVSQDFVENIFSVHYGRCQSLVSEPFSGIYIVSAFGLSSLILRR
ncbi:hypothetical protein GS458_1240 [Geobacillus stearothermophilus]|nr:hypothetical protein GS458_1240 [Geobacillus stearothermophilus]